MTQWYFASYRGKTLWVALAKQEPFVNGHPVYEPGDVWFGFGQTPLKALADLRTRLPVDAIDG